jgi:hypothetical protein
LRVARKLLLRFDGSLCQIQERSRRARRDELFSRSDDRDSTFNTKLPRSGSFVRE